MRRKPRHFSFGYNYIRINDLALTSENEKEKIMNHVIKTLNKKISIIVCKQKDLYYGPYTDEISDIILYSYRDITPRELIPLDGRLFMNYNEQNKIPSLMWSGDHSLYGVIILKDSNLLNSSVKKDTSILNIAPTILQLMKIPIPKYIDGKSLLSSLTLSKNSKLIRKIN